MIICLKSGLTFGSFDISTFFIGSMVFSPHLIEIFPMTHIYLGKNTV